MDPRHLQRRRPAPARRPSLEVRRRHRSSLHHGHLYGFRHDAFTYPPITAYLFVPFHVIGWPATAILWTVANVVVLALLFTITLWRFFSVPGPTAWLVSATGLAPAAIFLLYPFRSLLYWGQLALFIAVRGLRRPLRRATAGSAAC